MPSMPGMSSGSSFSYAALQSAYHDFAFPVGQVLLGGQVFSTKSGDMIIDEVHVEVTCGLEASVASFRIYDVFDSEKGKFRYKEMSKQVVMGNSVEIQLGYSGSVSTVFVGFVSGVSFGYELDTLPYVEVSCMDVKGLMMGGVYATQLKAKSYSAAVKEILNRTGEGNLKQMGGITALSVSDTPDVAQADGTKISDKTMEMVSESDYEFVVKAAKRHNFEFFVDRGTVYFRPAKKDATVLGTLGIRKGLQSFHIGYSITGVVSSIEARGMDVGQGKLISAKERFQNDISTAKKAKALVGRGAKVYVDTTITSDEDARRRVSSLMEQMSYRLGSLEADCVGIPELSPGCFIEIDGMGAPADNQFYLTTVTHDFTSATGYRTHIEGCANQVKGGAGEV